MRASSPLLVVALLPLLACPRPRQPTEPPAPPVPPEPEPLEPPPPSEPEPEPPAPMTLSAAPEPGCEVAEDELLEAPRIVGSLDDQAVREAVYQQLDRVGTCVDWAVGYDLLERGQLVVRLAVAPTGKVSTVELAADSAGGDPEVRTCFEKAFSELVFPRTSAVTWICYPINVAY
jgi:hypothetical protein